MMAQGIEVVAASGKVWVTIHQGVVSVPLRMGLTAEQAFSLANAIYEASVKVGHVEGTEIPGEGEASCGTDGVAQRGA